MGGLLTKCKRRQDQTQDSCDDRPWRRRPPSVVKMNAKDKRKARKSPVRPKKILKPSSTSDLEPTTAEDDFPAMKDWYLSLGFESIIDSAGATEEKLATHCPANLRRHLTLFHRMAKMASRDILERRATLAVPPHQLLVELGHISQLQPELEEWQPVGNAILIAKSLLVTLAIQDPTSPISKEWRMAEESSSLTGLAWLEAMATTVAEKTSIATLAAALREWQRLLVFLSDHGSLSNKNIKLFIKERATASPGTVKLTVKSLEWLQTSLLTKLYVDRDLVAFVDTILALKAHKDSPQTASTTERNSPARAAADPSKTTSAPSGPHAETPDSSSHGPAPPNMDTPTAAHATAPASASAAEVMASAAAAWHGPNNGVASAAPPLGRAGRTNGLAPVPPSAHEGPLLLPPVIPAPWHLPARVPPAPGQRTWAEREGEHDLPSTPQLAANPAQRQPITLTQPPRASHLGGVQGVDAEGWQTWAAHVRPSTTSSFVQSSREIMHQPGHHDAYPDCIEQVRAIARCLASANLQGYECLGAMPPHGDLEHSPAVELIRRFFVIRRHEGLKRASHCGGVPHRPDLYWRGWVDTPYVADAGNAAYAAAVKYAINGLTAEESKYLNHQDRWCFMEIKGLNVGNLADLAEAMLATNNYAYTVESNTTFSWAELRGGSYPIGDRVTYWFLSLLIQAASPVWMRHPQDSAVSVPSRGLDHRPPEPSAYTTPAAATGNPEAARRADAVDPWSAGDDPWTSARASAAMDRGDALSGSAPRWPRLDEQPARGHDVGA